MNNRKPKQTDRILQYMRDFGSITQLQAIADLGCMRLASRISELRKNGICIESRMIGVKNRYQETCWVKEYRLGETQNANLSV